MIKLIIPILISLSNISFGGLGVTIFNSRSEIISCCIASSTTDNWHVYGWKNIKPGEKKVIFDNLRGSTNLYFAFKNEKGHLNFPKGTIEVNGNITFTKNLPNTHLYANINEGSFGYRVTSLSMKKYGFAKIPVSAGLEYKGGGNFLAAHIVIKSSQQVKAAPFEIEKTKVARDKITSKKFPVTITKSYIALDGNKITLPISQNSLAQAIGDADWVSHEDWVSGKVRKCQWNIGLEAQYLLKKKALQNLTWRIRSLSIEPMKPFFNGDFQLPWGKINHKTTIDEIENMFNEKVGDSGYISKEFEKGGVFSAVHVRFYGMPQNRHITEVSLSTPK